MRAYRNYISYDIKPDTKAHLAGGTEATKDTVKLDVGLLQLSLGIGEGGDGTTSTDIPLLITVVLRVVEEDTANGDRPVTTSTSTPVAEDTRVWATLEALEVVEELDTALLGGTSHGACVQSNVISVKFLKRGIRAKHTRGQAAPQNFPAKAVIDLSRGTLGQGTLNDGDELPHSLVLLDTAELGAFNILTNSVVQIVTNEIDDHQVFSDFLAGSSQHLLSDLAGDVGKFADGSLNGTELADSTRGA